MIEKKTRAHEVRAKLSFVFSVSWPPKNAISTQIIKVEYLFYVKILNKRIFFFRKYSIAENIMCYMAYVQNIIFNKK